MYRLHILFKARQATIRASLCASRHRNREEQDAITLTDKGVDLWVVFVEALGSICHSVESNIMSSPKLGCNAYKARECYNQCVPSAFSSMGPEKSWKQSLASSRHEPVYGSRGAIRPDLPLHRGQHHHHLTETKMQCIECCSSSPNHWRL